MLRWARREAPTCCSNRSGTGIMHSFVIASGPCDVRQNVLGRLGSAGGGGGSSAILCEDIT